MAVFTNNGYLVASIAALLAIPAVDRPAFKVALLVAGVGWYEYDNAATTGGLTPADSPASGRWFPVSREVLRANRTYYVRTDGSDSNTGLANTSGGAFLTIQKAIDAVSSLYIGIFDVTIQVADGTYNQQLTLKPIVGAGTIYITGNISTPANATITSPAFPTIASYTQSLYDIKGFTITCTDAVYKICISSENGSIKFGNIIFPLLSVGGYHLSANGASAKIEASANYTISGGADIHVIASSGAFVTARGRTITLSGSPNFAASFVYATVTGMIDFVSNTYSGSATGKRYDARLNGVIFTNGATLSGSIAGTTATGGQYA